jgi:cytoskeleton protein RodZ
LSVTDDVTMAPSPEALADPGARLAAAREQRGLTQADVARELKLSLWQVEALEAGQFGRLPGPVFVRGFIRNYARLVRLDAGELMRAAGRSLPPSAPRPETPPSQDIPFPSARPRRWPGYAFAAAVVVALLALYEFYWNEIEPEIIRPHAVAPQPATATAAPAAPAAGATGQPAGGPAEEPAAPGAAAVAAAAADGAEPTAGERAAGSDAGRPDERAMEFMFNDESWVEIRDRGGNVIFSRLNRAGTRQHVRGAPPLRLVVGNAHGVQLTYEDRRIDLAPHTRADVARLTLK